MTEHFFMYNDRAYAENFAIISTGNRSLRYGDGLFETMKMVKGSILNKEFHFERLFHGLSILQFEIPNTFNAVFLEKKIKETIAKNKHDDFVRIRLMVFRGDGGLFDPEDFLPNYIIETSALQSKSQLSEAGLVIDIFPDTRKSCDLFSNLKSNNYLPSVMAALFAKRHQLNDCILLNSFERVCESAIANVFIFNGDTVYTPPLSEGCVAGVMRRWMLEKFNLKKYHVIEKKLSVHDLYDADEIFLTNAISHLSWVRKFRDKNYTNKKIKEIYNHIIETI